MIVPDLDRFLCPQGHYQDAVGAVKHVRGDGEHFTAAGSKLVASWLISQIPKLRQAGRRTTLDAGDAIATKLAAVGWLCSRQAVRTSAHPQNDPLAVYSCFGPSEPPIVQVAKSPTALPKLLAAERSRDCRAAGQRGEHEIHIAHGDIWIVTASAPLSTIAARTLGGRTEDLQC